MLSPRGKMPGGMYSDECVWILGGGPSLASFDFSLLHDVRVIGLNGAFALGPSICNCVFFGDEKFFFSYREDLRHFGGPIFSNAPVLDTGGADHICFLSRQMRGMYTNAIGWNYNSGAAAINLACIMGACRIYLLGFDMALNEANRSNWHDKGLDNGKADVYMRFQRGFEAVKRDMYKFPDVEIYNVSDVSKLKTFPHMSMHSGIKILKGA